MDTDNSVWWWSEGRGERGGGGSKRGQSGDKKRLCFEAMGTWCSEQMMFWITHMKPVWNSVIPINLILKSEKNLMIHTWILYLIFLIKYMWVPSVECTVLAASVTGLNRRITLSLFMELN